MSEEETGLSVRASAADIAALRRNSQSKYATELAQNKMTKSRDWLPYIQLMGSNATEVKKGEFPIGHFALCKNKKKIDLGDKFPMLILSWRPKAMIFAPKVVNYFDPESDDFKKIQATADQQDSGKAFGPEFLVWVPEVHELATYFMGSKTARNESPSLIAVLDEGTGLCQQESYLIETPKFSWHGPRTLDYDHEIEYPRMDLLQEELEKFNNPPATPVEQVEEGEEGGDRD